MFSSWSNSPTPGPLKGGRWESSERKVKHESKQVQNTIIAPKQMQPRCQGDITSSFPELSAQEKAALTPTLITCSCFGELPAAPDLSLTILPTLCPLGGMLRDISPFICLSHCHNYQSPALYPVHDGVQKYAE